MMSLVFIVYSLNPVVPINAADQHAVAREASMFASMQFERAYVVPTLFYLLFGFYGLIVITFIVSGMWFYGREGQGKGFQLLVSTFQRLIGLLSVPIVVVCFVLASLLVPAASIARAVSALFILKDKPPYLSGGKAMQLMSYGLGIVFGGSKKDPLGRVVKREWVGVSGKTAKMHASELKLVQYWIFASILIYLAILFIILAFLA